MAGQLQAAGPLDGIWHAGNSTDADEVRVERDGGEVVVSFAGGRTERRDLSSARYSSRMKGVPLSVSFEDGAVLVVPGGDDALRISRGMSDWLALLESRLLIALPVLLAAAAAVIVFLIEVVVPSVARNVTPLLSVEQVNAVGARVFDAIQNFWDIELDSQEDEHLEATENLRRIGHEIAEVAGGGYNYEFYIESSGKIGMNAFAIPDGSIIMTFDLYEHLDEDEVAAVLAHEVAHVAERHGMEGLVRGSAWFVISALLFGGGDSFLTYLPGLAEFAYSREAEAEADCVATDLLAAVGRPPLSMASALRALGGAYGLDDEDESGGIWDLLRTHPEIGDRVVMASQCAGQEGDI